MNSAPVLSTPMMQQKAIEYWFKRIETTITILEQFQAFLGEELVDDSRFETLLDDLMTVDLGEWADQPQLDHLREGLTGIRLDPDRPIDSSPLVQWQSVLLPAGVVI